MEQSRIRTNSMVISHMATWDILKWVVPNSRTKWYLLRYKILTATKERIQNLHKPNLSALYSQSQHPFLPQEAHDGSCCSNSLALIRFYPFTHRKAGLIRSATVWELKKKVPSPIIMFEVNKDTRPNTPDTGLENMEGGGAEKDKLLE